MSERYLSKPHANHVNMTPDRMKKMYELSKELDREALAARFGLTKNTVTCKLKEYRKALREMN